MHASLAALGCLSAIMAWLMAAPVVWLAGELLRRWENCTPFAVG
jgi:hypothetical protein